MNMRQNYKQSRFRLWLYVIFLAIAVGGMMYLHSLSFRYAEAPVNEPVADGNVRVCIQYGPTSYYVYGDSLGGFEYDLMRMVARYGGINVSFEPVVQVSAGIDALEKECCEVLIAQIPLTATMRERFLFSSPIFLDKQTLLQRTDRNGSVAITNQLQLGGDTVWVAKGSPIRDRVVSLGNEIGDTIFVCEDNEYNAEQLFLMVAQGTIRYAVVNESVAKRLVKDYPQVNISVNVSMAQFHAWAFGKNETALRDSVDSWLRHVKSSPEFVELYSRYFD